MPSKVRFTLTQLASGQHAITSPDIKGFCIVGAPGESAFEVERQAVDALMLLRQHEAGPSRGIAAIEFAAP